MNPVGLIYALLILIAVIIGMAYVRCFFKRLACLMKLRRACREYGLTLTAKHPLWFLGSRYARRCDLIIQGPRETFGVKLFGCLWPLKILILREYGEYAFRGFSTYLKFIINFIDSWPHPLPEYHFALKRANLPEDAPIRRILLVNPMPMAIHLQPNNGQEEISGIGDHICGMEIANLSHLLRLMENAG